VSRHFPALDIPWPSSLDDEAPGELLAALDGSRPMAVEERPGGLRIFFNTAADRDLGLTAIRGWGGAAQARAVDVLDEDWAARSQAALGAVRVGRILVAPPWDPLVASIRATESTGAGIQADRLIVIQPSMGFGTGHHASTRLCLELLQQGPMDSQSVLDVGTGSGVLAIAAWTLGAARVVGIDVDADALTSAQENLALNDAGRVDLRLMDFAADRSDLCGPFDVVTANLTGAMIERAAGALAALVGPGGRLIASGFQVDDEAATTGALSARGLTIAVRREEERWVAVQVQHSTSCPPRGGPTGPFHCHPHQVQSTLKTTTGATSARRVRGPSESSR
jgi:ribosomal protein L11 methyltransferase